MKILHPEEWITPQQILVVLAHPDDPEFFCGATLARWVDAGHSIDYLLLTRGDKGLNGWVKVDPVQLPQMREKEQRAAADVIGINKISLLDFEDGYLEPDLNLRKSIVEGIRKTKPDILVTCDPGGLFFRENAINHPDHLAAGKAALDAVYPASGNPMFFPDLLEKDLSPHSVKEVWLTLPENSNLILDITEYWGKKIEALSCHKSQIGDLDQFVERMKTRKTPESAVDKPRYVEKFRRINFR